MPLMSNVGLDLSSVVARVEQQVTAMLQHELAVLDINDSKYYGLNGIGAFIWRSIEDQGRARSVVEAVLDNLDVSRECCEEDVLSFLRELSDAGLVRVVT
jgi:hypothetical protein